MAHEFCIVESKGHVLEITLNRPEVYNALHPPANNELASVFDHFSNNEDLWVAILTGAGTKAFCSGNDLKYQASGQEMSIPDTGLAGLTSRFDLEKPIIAAVNGLALGGGMEIAMACDIVIAADSARFGLPEAKVGMFPGGGGVQMLRQQIGRRAANEILYTAKQIDAATAASMGIINEVVSQELLMDRAREFAAQICECSPSAIRTTKRLMNELDAQSGYADSMQLTMPAMLELIQTEDFQEGMQSFMERRKPKWKNK